MLVPRHAEGTLRKLAKTFPVVVVTGPRQSGKTTMVRHTFPGRPYVSLEDPDRREHAATDPRGFLELFPDGAVLDEVQRCPDLLSYLQSRVDEDGRMGLFVLTGSQQLGMLAGVTQSLAGRAALLPLLPFSLSELQAAKRAPADLFDLLHRGLYPPIHDRGPDPPVWFASYVSAYVERDVRQIVNVRDLTTFQRFVRLCAGRVGQLANHSGLAADCGISHNTAKAWLSILEASYVIFFLRPHHQSFNKRIIKTPKLYFHDPGLAAWLLGAQGPEHLAIHPQRGPLFEGFVIAEMLKARFARARESNIFFWRDRAGLEVDVVIDRGTTLDPVEIKSGRTLTSDFFAAMERWGALAGESAGKGWLAYGGDRRERRRACEVLPWSDLGPLLKRVAG